ncbi:MAG: hypothetical protein R6V07_11880, partial [Armatimonadota bacterium]
NDRLTNITMDSVMRRSGLCSITFLYMLSMMSAIGHPVMMRYHRKSLLKQLNYEKSYILYISYPDFFSVTPCTGL